MSKRNSGFSLLELMIVVAIIGILAAIAIPAYSDYTLRARITEATNALQADRVLLEQYYADNRTYVSTGPYQTPCGGGGANDFTGAAFSLTGFTVACAATATTYTITATGGKIPSTTNFQFTLDNTNTARTLSVGGNWAASTPTPVNCFVYKKGYQCN